MIKTKKRLRKINRKIQEIRDHKLREHWGIIILAIGLFVGMFLLGSSIYNSITTGQTIRPLEFSTVHFLGYLFFILSSPEILFILAIQQQQSFLLFFCLALGTALLAQTVDYGIGRFMSRSFIFHIIKRRKYNQYKHKICKYGGWVILFFNLSPFSSPLVLLTAGILRYKYSDAMKFSFVGLLLKYAILGLVFIVI